LKSTAEHEQVLAELLRELNLMKAEKQQLEMSNTHLSQDMKKYRELFERSAASTSHLQDKVERLKTSTGSPSAAISQNRPATGATPSPRPFSTMTKDDLAYSRNAVIKGSMHVEEESSTIASEASEAEEIEDEYIDDDFDDGDDDREAERARAQAPVRVSTPLSDDEDEDTFDG
jgi:hypothetical protein